MSIFQIKKSIHVAVVSDGVPEVFFLQEGSTIRGEFLRVDTITNQILIEKGSALWALPQNAVEKQ